MDQTVLKRALRLYGLDEGQILPRQKGYRNTSYPFILKNGQTINFIIYKVEPGILDRIRLANEVGDYLHGSGLPARRTYDQRIIKLQQGQTTAYGALYSYLPGQTIPWEAYTKAHIKLVGMAMAIMHAKLKQLDRDAPRVTEEYKAILARMKEYFTRPEVVAAMHNKLNVRVNSPIYYRLANVLGICATLPGQQLLHMDFVRGNLLFTESRPDDTLTVDDVALSGIIDFEKVAYGHPLFDVARTLAFLLVDCKSRAPEKVRKYFLYSGYHKRGHAPPALVLKNGDRTLSPLDELTDLFLFYDFYKFLRHNPYESLHENEHFVRTRDMLVARKMIQYS